jgi:hypothetical protein
MKRESSKVRGARRSERRGELTDEEVNRVLPEILHRGVKCSIQFQGDGTVRVKLGPYRTGPAKRAVTKTFDEAVRWLQDQAARQSEPEE